MLASEKLQKKGKRRKIREDYESTGLFSWFARRSNEPHAYPTHSFPPRILRRYFWYSSFFLSRIKPDRMRKALLKYLRNLRIKSRFILCDKIEMRKYSSRFVCNFKCETVWDIPRDYRKEKKNEKKGKKRKIFKSLGSSSCSLSIYLFFFFDRHRVYNEF